MYTHNPFMLVVIGVYVQGYQTRTGQQQVVRVQKDFTISAHLSEQEEQSTWEQESVFPDQATQERCLASRSTCTLDSACWPLIFDPHGQFEYYVNAMGYSDGDVASSTSHSPDVQEKGILLKLMNAYIHRLCTCTHNKCHCGCICNSSILDFPLLYDKN